MAAIQEASDALAQLVRDIIAMGRQPQAMELLQKMQLVEASNFDRFKEMMYANIDLQGQARAMAFAPAQALQRGEFYSPQAMSLLVDPLLRGELVSEPVRSTINQLAQEQMALGAGDIDRQFEEALRQVQANALGRNVLDVENNQLSTPSSQMFDQALQERTRQQGQLGSTVRGQALAQQLQTGLQLRQLLTGGLSEAFMQGIGGREAQQRAVSPFFNLASTGGYPQLPGYTPTPLSFILPGQGGNQMLLNQAMQPNPFGSILGTLGGQALSAGLQPLVSTGLRSLGIF
ncbi:MAG: hypothetical protein QMD05_09645 [Candidatus Brocadiaceae bacterium]|nr:hypothetical protein [Candidatus Brocadiaceae bacterium]